MAYVPLEAVKAYARIDNEDEDTLVSSLIDAAEIYLENAGVSVSLAPAALYQLAVCGIVLHWYDNRAAVDGSSPPDFEPGVRKVINQLKFTVGLMPNLDNC